MNERIFLSYSRNDGTPHAEKLKKMMEKAGHGVWMDRDRLDNGTYWRQIASALEKAEFLVMPVTPGALVSEPVRKEWCEARRQGNTILPVMETNMSRRDLPRWLRRDGRIYDLEDKNDRDKFLAKLSEPGKTFKADWDDGLRIEGFVNRDRLFNRIKEKLLGDDKGPVALISALYGRGGYGKSTLAGLIARDMEIRDAYLDGVYVVEAGRQNFDVLASLNGFIARISGGPGFSDIDSAAEELRRLVAPLDVLFILDDAWASECVDPFVKVARDGAASMLVTTRKVDLLPRLSQQIEVDAMESDEAVELLGWVLEPDRNERVSLAAFAKEFWYWPQLLAIVNGLLRRRIRSGQPLSSALETLAKGAREGRVPGEDEQHRTIANVMRIGIDDLGEQERSRFEALAAVPTDTTVPLAIFAPIWGIDVSEAVEFAQDLRDRALIQSVVLSDDDEDATIRMHDDMIWFLTGKDGQVDVPAAHRAVLDAHRPESGNWCDLDAEKPAGHYLIQQLLWHLEQAGEGDAATALRCDYAWIKTKLGLLGIDALLSDYRPTPKDRNAALIGNALALSRHALDEQPSQLGLQLWGRLDQLSPKGLSGFLDIAKNDDSRVKPVKLFLDPPGQQLLRMTGHKAQVTSVAFSPDGTRIVSGSWDETLRLWDAKTGAQIGEPLRGHEDGVISVDFSRDGTRIVSGSNDGTLRLWDAETGDPIGEPLRGHEDGVTSVAFSPDGTLIVSGSMDWTLRLWDAATGAQIGEPLLAKARVTSVAFSPDGTRIASGSWDNTLRLWDAETGAQIGEPLRGHAKWVASVAFSLDRARIVSGSMDETLRLWDAATGAQIGVPLSGLESGVTCAAVSPDGARIVSGSSDNTLRLWDAETGAQIGEPLRGHEDWVSSVVFSPDGARIASGSWDNTLRLWDAETSAQIGVPLRGHESEVTSVVFSRDGTRIVSGSDDRTLRLWDATTGAPIGEPLLAKARVTCAAVSPDGMRIVSGSRDNTLRLWDAVTGAPIGEPLPENWCSVLSVAFSPDGTRIVSGSGGGGLDGTLRLWDAETGAQIGEPLRGHESDVISVAFSPDGTRIVSGSWDETLRLWDAATGAPIGEPLRGLDGLVLSVAFSPDGTRIVSGSGGGLNVTLRLWDAETRAPIGEPLRGYEGLVTSVAFSPDGTRIVGGCVDKTLRLWDAETGAPIAVICDMDRQIRSLCANRTQIVVGDASGQIHIFEWKDLS